MFDLINCHCNDCHLISFECMCAYSLVYVPDSRSTECEYGYRLTWRLMQGPELGGILELLSREDGDLVDNSDFVPLNERMEALKSWLSHQVDV